ncbi:MFS transporter [Pelistega sp. MC2]|uniref:MFS transporter n=1 Tax=Pelistega sp. MC2 TaxID=1720297 RepID=UPI0008D8E21F|nr:MFS transporter [Pelistega sp. MC2]
MEKTAQIPLKQLLICGSLIVTLSMGIRHGFGLWQLPIITANGWSRETFSFAIAFQNLSWGFLGIFMGMMADRFGAYKVLCIGALAYCLGLLGMAYSTQPISFLLTTGLLIGLAQAGTTYAIVYGVLGRNVSSDKRSWAMGIIAAAGSFGQFFMVPVENVLIDWFNWQNALVICAILSLLIIVLGMGLREPSREIVGHQTEQSILHALQEAFTYPSFILLVLGYFTCGFQVVFIGVHLPSYIKDFGLPPHVGSIALALIGLFNIFGTYAVGVLGQKYQKRFLLMGIYTLRAIVIIIFISAPLSAISVYLFAAVMGVLWLSTVPATNAIVAQVFGIRHFSMLSGCVFFSHQVGAFFGVWLGGYLYDKYGSYDLVWYIAIGLSVVSALVHVPMNEGPIKRAAA